ncbi:TPA: hypothetical protein ACUKYG_000354 [Escherichia coli]|uniref:hypothetical protein n=1 Tax=Enterobacter cloacae complex TaxID=354276 RepID=UPI003967675D
MKITIFTEDHVQSVDADDGTLSWIMLNPDGSKSEAKVEMYEYRELSVHKFCYIARFREVEISEMRRAAIKHGYDVN